MPPKTYVRIDDHITENPAIIRVGPLAAWLFLAGLCYCSRQLSDGAIPAGVLGQLSAVDKPHRHAAALVAEGLWQTTTDGWQVVDYTQWQRSRAEVERLSAKRAAAGSKGGASGKQTGSKTGSKGTPETEADTDTKELENTSTETEPLEPVDKAAAEAAVRANVPAIHAVRDYSGLRKRNVEPITKARDLPRAGEK